MKKSYDVLIVGIGGQGTILASNVLGDACVLEGRHVRGAETHGMSQRGGSVETHIRIDGKFGSLIAPGTADLLIAFDVLEALRYRHFLKPNGTMIINREMVVPTSVYSNKLPVPKIEDVEAELKTMAEMYGMEVDKLKEFIKDGERENLKDELKLKKAVNVIVDAAKVKRATKKKEENE